MGRVKAIINKKYEQYSPKLGGIGGQLPSCPSSVWTRFNESFRCLKLVLLLTLPPTLLSSTRFSVLLKLVEFLVVSLWPPIAVAVAAAAATTASGGFVSLLCPLGVVGAVPLRSWEELGRRSGGPVWLLLLWIVWLVACWGCCWWPPPAPSGLGLVRFGHCVALGRKVVNLRFFFKWLNSHLIGAVSRREPNRFSSISRNATSSVALSAWPRLHNAMGPFRSKVARCNNDGRLPGVTVG